MVQWKTISHIPLASYVMHPIVTQHVMYVYISMFTTIKQGSKISGVFPKHFRHKKKLCQVSEGVVVLHNLCPWKASPKGTSSLKQNDWNRGPLGIWRVSILPQSHPRNPPQQKFANKSLAPGNMTSQQSRPLASVHAPRCASPGQWSWHLNPPEGHVPKRLVSCLNGLEGGDPWLSRRTDQKSLPRRSRETGRWRGGEVWEF